MVYITAMALIIVFSNWVSIINQRTDLDMRSTSLFIFKLTVFLLFFQSIAHASLLIAPLRVVFDDRERGKTVTIINTSDTKATYRLEVVNQQQLPDGSYKDIPKDTLTNSQTFFADEMLRVSPRQVALKPGERQEVRLGLRKPAHLTDGEYRSHLKFTELPTPEMLEKNPKGAGIKIYMLTSFTIPVQVRQGQLTVNAQINDAKIKRTKQGSWQVETEIKREGDFSSFGKLTVYWRANAKESYKELNFVNNAAVYRETDKLVFHVVLQKEQVRAGQYKVAYLSNKSFKQKLFDEFEFDYSGK